MTKSSVRLAILASGSGSNAEKIANYFSKHASIQCSLLICNKEDAGVFKRFEKYTDVASVFLPNKAFQEVKQLHDLLKEHAIDYIILAGFLLKIPAELVKSFPHRIINIHPALLPKYGGKGMYGHFVHEAVIKNQELESGITIHEVNEAYDEGAVIFQAKCKISAAMDAEQLASKVQQLEHQHYPKVIEQYILNGIRH